MLSMKLHVLSNTSVGFSDSFPIKHFMISFRTFQLSVSRTIHFKAGLKSGFS